MKCCLCGNIATSPYLPELLDAYRECGECRLVFLEHRAHLSLQAERERYLKHQNSPQDEGYRKYLLSAIDPLVERLESPALDSLGLDFGCGPGPSAHLLLRERGYRCLNYDPFFAFDPELLQRQYDFVLATEVVEHLRKPDHAWALLHRLLRPGALLVVRTQILTQEIDFESWWYRHDRTHICFYREETMEWIDVHFGWTMSKPSQMVRIFRREES